MEHYYEIGKSGELIAFDDLEKAMTYADKHNCSIISEIGGAWDDFEKCSFCGEWFTSTELNINRECERCETAIKDHGAE